MKKRLIIIFILISAFFIANFSSKNIFIANTPKINKQFIAQLGQIFQNRSRQNKEHLAVNPNPAPISANTTNTLSKAILKKISSGVYAGEYNKTKVFVYKENEIEWIEYTFNVNGKAIKIRVPKGQQPPSQKDVDFIFK